MTLFRTEANEVLDEYAKKRTGQFNPDDTLLMMDPFISEQLEGFYNKAKRKFYL